jgi:hypothetical protein
MGLGRRKPKIKKGSDFEPEYIAVLDRATVLGYTLPDSATNIRNNDRVKFLKQVGAWSKFDLFYIFDNPSGLANFSKINYVDPTKFQLFNPTPALEPDFVSNSGFKGDGTKWFDTGYNLSTDKINLADGSEGTCVIGYKGFDFSANSTDEAICGARIGNDTKQIFIVKSSNNTGTLERVLNSQGAVVNFLATENNDYITMSKNTSTSNTYRNGADSEISRVMANNTFVAINLWLFAVNQNGTPNFRSLSGLSYFFIGSDIGFGTPPTNLLAIDIYDIMRDSYTP